MGDQLTPAQEADEVGRWLGATDAPVAVIAAQERVAAALAREATLRERVGLLREDLGMTEAATPHKQGCDKPDDGGCAACVAAVGLQADAALASSGVPAAEPCPVCSGDGWTREISCCLAYLPGGECCDEPEPDQVECATCNGTGLAAVPSVDAPSSSAAISLLTFPAPTGDEKTRLEGWRAGIEKYGQELWCIYNWLLSNQNGNTGGIYRLREWLVECNVPDNTGGVHWPMDLPAVPSVDATGQDGETT